MLSLTEYRAGLCPICGYPKDVCQALENVGRFDVPPPARCHATTALRQFQKDREYDVPDALVWSAILKPPTATT